MSKKRGNGEGSKRAILYARVSTEEQAKRGYSLAQQLEALREYAARPRVRGPRRGIGPWTERRQPGEAWYGPCAGTSWPPGDVSVVLAQDRDRFAREPAYHYLLKREFEEHGAKVRAMNDRGDDTPEGELTDGILDQLAKFERAKTAERSRRG